MALRSHMKAPSYKHPLLICRASSSRRQKSRRLTRESRSPVKLSESAKNAFEMMLEDGNNYEAVQVGYQQSKDGLNMVLPYSGLNLEGKDLMKSSYSFRFSSSFKTSYAVLISSNFSFASSGGKFAWFLSG